MTFSDQEQPYRFESALSQEREAFLTNALVGFNRAQKNPITAECEPRQVASALHIFAVDTGDAVVGGVTGRTHSIPAWLEVSIVWVDEAARGRGLGRQLMQRAEGEAVRRGCRYARLATSDFQAPGFYAKLGYTLYGRLDDCPPGETVFYFRKDLNENVPFVPLAEEEA